MKKIKAWIAAARLRTLPLSISGIIIGSSLGYQGNVTTSMVFWLAILTTIGFQVLSNFANDYGDGIKGADTNRKGERRMVASGIITPKHMKVGMIITGIITLIIASILIFTAFGKEHFLLAFMYFNLAILSIIAAVKYTVGNNAYGYSGLGDLFVFLFFGLLSVMGSSFLYTKELTWMVLLPAFSMGLFSAAVLNLNNMRDIVTDEEVGKNTLVVKLGSSKAKKYHFFLLFFGMAFACLYTIINYHSPKQFIYTIAFVPMIFDLIKVAKNKQPHLLDSELKKVALSTFAFAILFSWLH